MKTLKPNKAGTRLSAFVPALLRFFVSITLSLCASVPLCPSTAYAEVPVKFTYQGNLRQSGFLVNGQRSMMFRIYSSSTAGTLLWETGSPIDVSVSTGVFRVTLEPTTITDWQSGSLWLELQIETYRMSPREELTSSPYAINSLMLSGKRYTSAAAPPTAYAVGDLWYDTSSSGVSYWNGSAWMSTSGTPGPHRDTHAGTGGDAIISLGTHTVTGALTVEGRLNPAANLNIGGGGYSVAFASSVTAGWFTGNGLGLYSLDASKITTGLISGDRIGNVIVSTHIVDGSIQNVDLAAGAITLDRLNQSTCNLGQLVQWNGTQWSCGNPGAVVETDPLSILKQDTLQTGATFYVSSGTVNYFAVNNSMTVNGTARIKGSPATEGLFVNSLGKTGVGTLSPLNNLSVSGNMGVGAGYIGANAPANGAIIEGNVGIGTSTPAAKIEVSGGTNPGDYIMIFKSGSSVSAWLRKK